VRLTFSSDAVVVVAGMPGAGKTTLIRRAADRNAARVVDTDDHRRGPGPARYLAHYARIAVAVAGRRPAVIHSRGTHAAARRAIAGLAALRGRPAHLVLLDAARAEAEAGQRARGRTVGRAEMDRQTRRWRRLVTALPGDEGWASVVVLDRPQAARVGSIEFAAAPEARPVAATM
jgi:predicted kinase